MLEKSSLCRASFDASLTADGGAATAITRIVSCAFLINFMPSTDPSATHRASPDVPVRRRRERFRSSMGDDLISPDFATAAMTDRRSPATGCSTASAKFGEVWIDAVIITKIDGSNLPVMWRFTR